MTTREATDLNTRQRHESSYGNTVTHYGKHVTAALASGDVIRLVRIPGGSTVHQLAIINDEVDTNGAPSLVCRVGYEPCNSADGPTADDDYFFAAGQTFLQVAAQHNISTALPKKFDYDVWITVTANAAIATLNTAAVVAAHVLCEGNGR
jgi:hypothetical protein